MKRVGIGYVYDKEIYEKSIKLIEKYDNQILREDIKIQLVDNLYSKETLKDTKFYNQFQKSFFVLENIIDYDTSKKDSQLLLRNIDNIDVIPKCIYEENLDLFKQYENTQDIEEKYKLRRELNKLFISINKSNKWSLSDKIIDCPYLKHKYIIDTKYDKEIGLVLQKDEDYEISTREF